jgi:hypothetical protein
VIGVEESGLEHAMSSKAAAGVFVVVLGTTALSVIACAPESVDGAPYSGNGGRAARSKERKNNASNPVMETPGGEATGSTSAAQTQGGALDAGGAAVTPTATTTTTPPPPPPPSCQSPSDQACFDCCLDANPGAGVVENAYDNCLFNCFDDFCADNCDAQHNAQCNGNAGCRAHHACLQANGCFGIGF